MLCFLTLLRLTTHTPGSALLLLPLQDLAKKKKIKTLGVSMGQGQEIIARKYMATATVEGQWVLLQNTHLGLSYLTEVCTAGSCMPSCAPASSQDASRVDVHAQGLHVSNETSH